MFLEFSLAAIQSERSLHFSYLKEFECEEEESIPSPTCLLYTQYLLKTAYIDSLEEAVAALIPCFWVYCEVGKRIAATKSVQENPYERWIRLYSSEAFEQSVDRAIAIMNTLALHASADIRSKMKSAFTHSTKLEWLFWESAYKREAWPI